MLGRQWTFFAVLLLASLILGCNNRAALTDWPSGVDPPGNSPRIGDRAKYSVQMSMPAPWEGGPTIEMVGTYSVRVTASPDHGRYVPPHIVRSFDLQTTSRAKTRIRMRGVPLPTGSGTNRTTLRLGEDTTGNLYLLGVSMKRGEWDPVTNPNPPLYMPYEVQLGQSWSGHANFCSGNTMSWSSECIGVERIQTPMGEYNAYKLKSTFSTSLLFLWTVSGYWWHVTDMPLIFEARGDAEHDNMSGMTMSYVLQSFRRGK